MASTYSELKTEIANFLDRDDLTSVIPTFISLAESWMAREIKTMAVEDVLTTTLTAGTETLSVPSNFNGIRAIYLNTNPKKALDNIGIDYLRRIWAGSTSGEPCVYAISDGNFYFGPTPDSDYSISIHYYTFTPLSDTNATNGLLERYPDLYLYVSLLYAYRYLMDEAKESMVMSYITEMLSNVVKDDNYLRYGASPLSSRVVM